MFEAASSRSPVSAFLCALMLAAVGGGFAEGAAQTPADKLSADELSADELSADELDAALAEMTRMEQRGEVDEALELGAALLDRVEREHGEGSPEAARVQAGMGDVRCRSRRDLELGLEEARRAAEIVVAAQPEIDPRPALQALGWCLLQTGSFEEARQTLARAVAYRGRDSSGGEARPGGSTGSTGGTGGTASTDALGGQLLLELAVAERASGDTQAARRRLEDALRLAESASPPMELVRRNARSFLGVVAWEQGDLTTAARQLELVLEEAVADGTDQRTSTAAVRNNYGLVLHDLGRWTDARRQYEQAVAIARAHDYPGEASYLNNLGNLAQDLGDWAAGEDAYSKSLEIDERVLGPDHPNVARTLTNLGNLLRVTGRLDEAERRYRRALEIRERTLGDGHPDLAYTLINLGHLERRRGRFVAAEELYQQALDLRVQAFGEEAPIVAQTIHERCRLRLIQGRPDDALVDCGRALELREAAFGPEHLTVAGTLSDLATAALLAGDSQLAARSAARAEVIGRRHFRLAARRLSERESLSLSSLRVGGRDVLLTLAAREGEGPHVAQAFEAVIRSRNIALEEAAIRHEALRDASPALEERFSELLSASARLGTLLAKGEGGAGAVDAITEARATVEGLERDVAERSATLRRARLRPSLDQVLELVPEGSALVSFVRYQDHSSGRLREGRGEGLVAPAAYLALVGGRQGARAIPLGEAAALEDAIARWRREVRAPALGAASEQEYRAVASELREALWEPLEPLLNDVERVFVVPDGELHLVNLATLPTGERSYLVESGPRFDVLVAETDLLRGAAAELGEGILVVGAPDFEVVDAGASGAQGAARSEDVAPTLRGEAAACPSLAGVRFERIPGTGEEAKAIEELWNESAARAAAAGHSSVLVGRAATESAVKAGAGGRRIVHLATHGFSLESNCSLASRGIATRGSATRDAANGVRGVGGLTPTRSRAVVAPLSGVVLAGANRALERGDLASEDGLLTSLEVGGLDLRRTEWVVLSACDTGVGPTVGGEGILGLHRAFLAAGARTVITSLWAVEDASARRWMEHLYRARLIDGRSTGEAVRTAMIRSLSERRGLERDTHPFHWGAFQAIGDWR